MKHDLDDAIDRAVREMLAIEPRPGIRQRVFDRLAAPKRSGLSGLWLAPAAGLAAAFVIALAIWSWPDGPAPTGVIVHNQPAPTRPPAASTSARIEARGSVDTPSAKPARGARHERQEAPTPTREDRSVRAASIETVAPLENTVHVAPIVEIVPIRVADLRQSQIGDDEITIALLTLDQIEIPPLTDRR